MPGVRAIVRTLVACTPRTQEVQDFECRSDMIYILKGHLGCCVKNRLYGSWGGGQRPAGSYYRNPGGCDGALDQSAIGGSSEK